MATYDEVNAAWPAGTPAITVAESSKMAARLWRAFYRQEGAPKDGLRYHVARGYRSWGSTERTRETLAAGWRRMVHDVSHIMRHKANRQAKSHGPVHADLELRMIRHVVESGWLAPKTARPKPNLQAERYRRTLRLIEEKEAKVRRLERALVKLQARKRYYERKGIEP